MMVKRISFFTILFVLAMFANAQVTPLEEKKPETVNGIEFDGMYATNRKNCKR